jgi:zinc protease
MNHIANRPTATAFTLLLTLTICASSAFAQKEPALPKDLPVYGPEKPLQTPDVKTTRLDNGLTVWLVSKPGFPKVALSVAVRGGLAADPGNLPGLSELLSKTIDQGTRTRTAKQIAQELQATGGDLSANADKDRVEISTVVLSSKVDGALHILADVLQNATFPEAEVTLAKRNLSDSLEQREAEPSFLAGRARDRAVFGKHPYHVTSPTRDSVAASGPADLRGLYAQRFRPDQSILVAVGDFQNDKMLDTVKSVFAAWKSPSSAPIAAVPPPTATPEHVVFIVPRPGSVQTTIEFGALAPSRGDPDFAAVEVANAMYGGEFSSRLTNNIREDKGYTYSPYSYINPFQSSAELISHADVRNEVTAPTLNEMQYELNRLATTSPTDEEMSKARRYLIGSEALRLQDRGSLAGRLSTLWIAGLPPEQIGIYGEKIAHATVDEVNAAARKYFAAYHCVIVAVGEEKVLREAVAPLGLQIRPLP